MAVETAISVRHVTDPEGKLPNYPGYRIAVGDVPIFLLTFNNSLGLVGLHWGGHIDFKKMADTANYELLVLREGRPITPDSEAKISFTLTDEGIQTFDLQTQDGLRDYAKRLKNPDEIGAIRLDLIDGRSTPPYESHVYVDNPISTENPEIIVHIPKGQRWPEDAVKFAVRNASEVSIAANLIDAATLTQVLNELSELGPFQQHQLLVDDPISQEPSN